MAASSGPQTVNQFHINLNFLRPLSINFVMNGPEHLNILSLLDCKYPTKGSY